jgi:CelD/BcsL family acetyltransferase involved in cellulose biosynthesis
MMRWHVFDTLASCAAEWRAFEQAAIATPFQRFGWLEAWQETIGVQENVAPRVLFGFEGERLAAILPLALEPGRAPRLVWMGWRWSNYNAPLLAPWLAAGAAAELGPSLVPELRRLVPEASYLYLAKQPETIAGLQNPFAAEAQPDPNPAFMLRLPGEGERRNIRSSKTRRRIAEKEKRLKTLGPVEYNRIEGADDLARHVGILLGWKAEQLKERGVRSALGTPQAAAFLSAAAERTDSGVEVHALQLDGKPLAIALCLLTPTTLVIYQTGYAFDDKARFSPGLLLLTHLLNLALERRLAVFDLSIGREQYKDELCDTVVQQCVSVAALRPSGALPAYGARGQAALKAYAGSRPAVMNALRRLRKTMFGRILAPGDLSPGGVGPDGGGDRAGLIVGAADGRGP